MSGIQPFKNLADGFICHSSICCVMFLYILGIENDDTLATDLSDDNLYDSIIRKSLLRNDGN